QRQEGRGNRGSVPRVRRAAARALGPDGQVPRLLGLSRVPLHAKPQRRRACRGSADRRDLPDVWQADGDQARPLRQIHRVLRLSRMQDHQAGHAGHQVLGARLQRRAGGAPIEEGPHVLRLLGVSELQVCRVAAADQRAVPQVRSAVPHGAGRQGSSGAHLPARGLRLQAGGRDHRRMREPVTAFLRHLEVERHSSPHTVRAYRRDLDDWIGFMTPPSRNGAAAAIDQRVVIAATSRDVRAWLAALHARGLDPRSLTRKLAAVRSLYRFLARRGVMRRNPGRDVRAPRPSRKLVTFLPTDEANAVVDGRGLAGDTRDRDVAVLEMLYATGLRVSELASLDLDAVDREARTVRVLGKGGKERMVPYGAPAARALDAYLGRRATARGPVFVNQR